MSYNSAVCQGEFNLNTIKLRKKLTFPDDTVQSTAYTGGSGVPDLEEVLTSGNDANNLSVTGVNALSAVSVTASSLVRYDNTANKIVPFCPSTSSSIVPSFELLVYRLGGDTSTESITMTLTKNVTATTNYAVFPSIYYGYTGSAGTYNAVETSGACGPIVISGITATEFVFNLTKTTGNNVNIDILFLVVYQIDESDNAKSWS